MVRNILLALLSSLAKVAAQKISERTKAGMARAKAKGIKIGRPKLGIELRRKIAQRATKGETPYSIAKALGVDRRTAANGAADLSARALFVKQRLPVCGHRSGRSRCRLIQRTRARSLKLRPGEGFFSTIIVKPMLARLEARDYRVPRRRVMFRRMLIW